MLKSFAKAVVPARWRAPIKRRINWIWNNLTTPRRKLLRFTCNICGSASSFPREKMTRELPSCVHCGSSVRFRSIIHTLSLEIFGRSLVLSQFPVRKDLKGAGMSDWDGYANRLKAKFDYVNTYYHQEPLLDVASVDPSHFGRYDFLIATEVFEHVAQPISIAFENACRCLKPGGVLIFSVPFVTGATREHFPELHQYSLAQENGRWVLTNEKKNGQQQRYDGLTFHGGPGTVLEMRLFGKDSLKRHFEAASFQDVHLHGEEVAEFGIIWNTYDPRKAPYRPYIYGLDAPPWSARRGES